MGMMALQQGGKKPLWFLGPAFSSFILELQCMQETAPRLFPEQEIGKAHDPPFTTKLSWDMETLMSRLELHKLQSLDPDHKYVLLRPHQNGSAFKELTSAGVSELLAMIKFGPFCSVFSQASGSQWSLRWGQEVGICLLMSLVASGTGCQTGESPPVRKQHCKNFSTGHVSAVWSVKLP